MQHHAQGVDVHRVVVATHTDLGCHVVNRAHRHGMAGAVAGADHLAEAIVADLDKAILVEDVVGLQVAVHDAAVVQVGQALGHLAQKIGGLGRAQSRGRFVQQLSQGRPGDELHDHKRLAFLPLLDIKDAHQVRALQVHAVADAAQFDLLIVLHGLQGHLPPRITQGVVHLAKSTAPHTMLDGVAFQWPIAVLISESRHFAPRFQRNSPLHSFRVCLTPRSSPDGAALRGPPPRAGQATRAGENRR